MYRVYYDELGDEVVELDEDRGKWSLPPTYRQIEVLLAASNMWRGHDRADLAISRSTLHAGVQYGRSLIPGWGERFKKDPRRFSSVRGAV